MYDVCKLGQVGDLLAMCPSFIYILSHHISHTTRNFSPSGSLLEFFVLKLVVCNHILFNKVVIEKLNIIILNPINQSSKAIF